MANGSQFIWGMVRRVYAPRPSVPPPSRHAAYGSKPGTPVTLRSAQAAQQPIPKEIDFYSVQRKLRFGPETKEYKLLEAMAQDVWERYLDAMDHRGVIVEYDHVNDQFIVRESTARYTAGHGGQFVRPQRLERASPLSEGDRSRKQELTQSGNKITRGFSFAGSRGTELDMMSYLMKKGYEELYYDAPYYWAVINIPEKKVYTYTEGDTALIEAPDMQHLIAEVQGTWDFLKGQGYSKAVYGEIPYVMEKMREALPGSRPIGTSSGTTVAEGMRARNLYGIDAHEMALMIRNGKLPVKHNVTLTFTGLNGNPVVWILRDDGAKAFNLSVSHAEVDKPKVGDTWNAWINRFGEIFKEKHQPIMVKGSNSSFDFHKDAIVIATVGYQREIPADERAIIYNVARPKLSPETTMVVFSPKEETSRYEDDHRTWIQSMKTIPKVVYVKLDDYGSKEELSRSLGYATDKRYVVTFLLSEEY